MRAKKLLRAFGMGYFMVAFRVDALWLPMALNAGENLVLDQDYPSTLESVDLAEAEILKAAEEAGFDEDEQHRIGMAVRECMVNAVVHGNRYNRRKPVHVNVVLERTRQAARLIIRIADQGEGFEV